MRRNCNCSLNQQAPLHRPILLLLLLREIPTYSIPNRVVAQEGCKGTGIHVVRPFPLKIEGMLEMSLSLQMQLVSEQLYMVAAMPLTCPSTAKHFFTDLAAQYSHHAWCESCDHRGAGTDGLQSARVGAAVVCTKDSIWDTVNCGNSSQHRLVCQLDVGRFRMGNCQSLVHTIKVLCP